jgi:hypothetical protein
MRTEGKPLEQLKKDVWMSMLQGDWQVSHTPSLSIVLVTGTRIFADNATVASRFSRVARHMVPDLDVLIVSGCLIRIPRR